MGDVLRIVIAEDHPFFRDGLRQALEQDEAMEVVAETSDGRTALASIRSLRPDIAILDIGLPELDGCNLARIIREEKLPVELIFLTISDDPEIFEEALELEVKGYLLKDCTSDEILKCVRAVSAGQNFASPAMTTYLVGRTRRIERFSREVPGLQRLTRQERAILQRIAQGRTSKEIAVELHIAPKTVDAVGTDARRGVARRGSDGAGGRALRPQGGRGRWPPSWQ